MKIQQLLGHYGISKNPFDQEDAQSDAVFKQHCLEGTHHPAWDKVYGSPTDPSTAVVFGEKGAGKTAMRLQVVDHIRHYNAANPDRRVFVIEYDDFNPFLDCFRERLSSWHRPEQALKYWRLWDHMDAILTLGVSRLVNAVLGEGPADPDAAFTVNPAAVEKLTAAQRRDLLLLAAFYDRAPSLNPVQRWRSLRRKLRFPNWAAGIDYYGAISLTVLVLVIWLVVQYETLAARMRVFGQWWFWAILGVAWAPWLWRQMKLLMTAWGASGQIRVIDHQPNTLRQILARFPGKDLSGQPVPSRDRSEDRYELISKFQSILQTLGFHGILVLVDRVDEPHLINGAADRMKALIWPMFDNKFLKQPGIGFKLLLPAELSHFLTRENKEFYEKSRLDKQNLIPSLEWTGESLFDVANARIQACASGPGAGGKPTLRSLFDDSISDGELIGTFARLRVPRHLFKFLYRLLTNHCNKYTETNPKWKIDRDTLQATLAVYQRDLEAFDRGMGTG